MEAVEQSDLDAIEAYCNRYYEGDGVLLNVLAEVRAARAIRDRWGDGYVYSYARDRHICLGCLSQWGDEHEADCPLVAYDTLRAET